MKLLNFVNASILLIFVSELELDKLTFGLFGILACITFLLAIVDHLVEQITALLAMVFFHPLNLILQSYSF